MRLFVAVEIPADVRDAVAAAVAPARASLPALRWVAPERYHLTLVFLGTVEDEVMPATGAAMGRACEGVSAFSLALSGEVGTFGRRVVWAGLQPSEALSALAARLAAALSPVVPLPDGERPFSAHLTLARTGRRPVSLAALAGVAVPALSWNVRRVVLMSSGTSYRVEHAVDLPAANA